MKYIVKNTFYLHGELVHPGETVELTEDEVEYFAPKDVLGKKVKDTKQAGDLNAQTKTSDPTGSGTSNAEHDKTSTEN